MRQSLKRRTLMVRIVEHKYGQTAEFCFDGVKCFLLVCVPAPISILCRNARRGLDSVESPGVNWRSRFAISRNWRKSAIFLQAGMLLRAAVLAGSGRSPSLSIT